MQIRPSLFVFIFELIEEEVGLRAHPSVSAMLSKIPVLPLTSFMLSVRGLLKVVVLAVAISVTRLFRCSIRSFSFLLRDSDNLCPYLILSVVRGVSHHPRNALEVLHTCAANDRKERESEWLMVYN